MESSDRGISLVFVGLAVALVLLVAGIVFGVHWAQGHLLAQVDQYSGG